MAFRVNFELGSVPCLAVFTTNTPWKGERHEVTIEFLRTTNAPHMGTLSSNRWESVRLQTCFVRVGPQACCGFDRLDVADLMS